MSIESTALLLIMWRFCRYTMAQLIFYNNANFVLYPLNFSWCNRSILKYILILVLNHCLRLRACLEDSIGYFHTGYTWLAVDMEALQMFHLASNTFSVICIFIANELCFIKSIPHFLVILCNHYQNHNKFHAKQI